MNILDHNLARTFGVSALVLIGIGIFVIQNVNASETAHVSCFTDKLVYQQRENVVITITNNSDREIFVADRRYIDGGFAAIEIKHDDGTWRAIELYAAANILVSKALKVGESHAYIWKTIGYNRSDTVAGAGSYRIFLNNGLYSNEFEIRENVRR